MKKTIIRHGLSFRNALAGVFWALKTQPNMVVHLLAALGAVGAGFYFNLSKEEWLVLTLTIALVATAELLNTAVEVVSDLVKLKKLTEKEDRLVMLAKDVSAGAVLLAALGAAAVGVLIFGPRILLLRQGFTPTGGRPRPTTPPFSTFQNSKTNPAIQNLAKIATIVSNLARFF